MRNLEADPDLNRRFKQKDNAELTTLGLKVKDDPTGCSLKIIGAAAYRMALSKSLQGSMENVTTSLPETVPLNDVLTAIRTQVEATNNFIPYDVNKRVYFSTDDCTTLAAHISAKYPAIADYKSSLSVKGKEIDEESPAPLLEQLVDRIIQSRRQKDRKSKPDSLLPDGPDILPYPPNGRAFQEYWQENLSRLEKIL